MEQTPAPLAKPAIFSGADASSTLEGNGNTCFPDSSQTRDLGFPQYSVGQALLCGGGGGPTPTALRARAGWLLQCTLFAPAKIFCSGKRT